MIRELLARWVASEIELDLGKRSRDRQVALAQEAHGMWADRDPAGPDPVPDAFLVQQGPVIRAR